jgi:hypothetical protein
MTRDVKSTAAYARQLERWSRALVSDQSGDVLGESANTKSIEGVRLFAKALRQKRLQALKRELAFLADKFADLGDRLISYMTDVPPAAHEVDSGDARRFLDWIENRGSVTLEQRDFIAAERARQAVRNKVRRGRQAHLQFFELWSEQTNPDAEMWNGRQYVHLNPARQRCRLQTSVLLGKGVPLPAHVVTFAIGPELRSVILGPKGVALMGVLADRGPCAVRQLTARTPMIGRHELMTDCRDLARVGLVALE